MVPSFSNNCFYWFGCYVHSRLVLIYHLHEFVVFSVMLDSSAGPALVCTWMCCGLLEKLVLK